MPAVVPPEDPVPVPPEELELLEPAPEEDELLEVLVPLELEEEAPPELDVLPLLEPELELELLEVLPELLLDVTPELLDDVPDVGLLGLSLPQAAKTTAISETPNTRACAIAAMLPFGAVDMRNPSAFIVLTIVTCCAHPFVGQEAGWMRG